MISAPVQYNVLSNLKGINAMMKKTCPVVQLFLKYDCPNWDGARESFCDVAFVMCYICLLVDAADSAAGSVQQHTDVTHHRNHRAAVLGALGDLSQR